MSSIDNRVVNMQFNNAEFQQRVAATLKSLDALNKGLKLEGATKGLQDLGAASKNVNLSHVEAGVQGIADKFKAMSIIGITALTTIAHKAIEVGSQLVKSFTIDPLTSGFKEYETNLNSIQTVLANTSKAGTTLKDVNKALAELNEYSDQTIYNFSEMAKNIGTFTAAGVSLDKATAAIKGIANLAALSGSNSQQAATAMYQLSQAISAGKVSLEDWNSVVNAGMGGKVFQEALMQTARVHGVAIDDMIKKQGSFRLTLQDGWLTGEILTETLMQFTGDLNDATLKSMGYSQKQIAEIQKLAKVAKAAATEVKTFSQLLSTIREGIGSGWARTWELIFGDFDEAKKLWTGVNNVLGDFIKGSADARNQVIGDWKALGGRTVIIEAISNAFTALLNILRPIKDAFRNVFPAVTGKQLFELSVRIRDFTEKLIIGSAAMSKIAALFTGLFSVVSLGLDIVFEAARFFFNLFGVVTEGSGSILDAAANFGDFLTAMVTAIKQGQGVRKFFESLTDFLEPPIRLLKSIGALLGGLFDGFDGSGIANKITKFFGALEPIGSAGEIILAIWEKTFDVLTEVFTNFFSFASRVTSALKGIGGGASTALGGIDFQGIMGIFTTGAFAAFIFSLRGMAQNVGGIFDSITDSLGAMQNTLRAATLLQIAIAIGVLSAAVLVLSKIDPGDLTSSLTAITVLFIQLMGAMLVFEKLSGFKGFAKMPFVAASMILLGVAINLLALAVKQLATLSWDDLKRGLTGLTAILALLIATMHLMPNPVSFIAAGISLIILGAAIHVLVGAVTDLAALSWEDLSKGLIGVGALLGALGLFTKYAQVNAAGVLSGAGILLLAVAIKLLVSAVSDFADMSWAEIGRGLSAMAGALTAVGLALSLVPPSAPLVAAGFLIMAPALIIIGQALEQMGDMKWDEIGRGLTVLAGAMVAIGLALSLVPPTAPLVAAGFLILAPALLIISAAIKDMATMSWGEIAKGLVTLAGALIIIGVAIAGMSASITGAAALLVVAASLAILAPILKLFSGMSWEEIAKGLAMLAGVFVVLGVAGLALAGLVPALIGLGVAIALLGTGVILAGAGVFLFASALTALAIAGAAGTLALVAMVGALAGLIPEVMKQIGLGIVAFANAIAQAHPALVGALVAVLEALIDAIVTLAPKIWSALATLLEKMLTTMLGYMPKMIDLGLKLIAAFLQGVANNIGRVVDSAVNLVINFLGALQKNLPRLIQAGVDFVLSFVNGVANAIRSNSTKIGEAGANLGSALIEGMFRALIAGAGKIASKAADIARSALSAAKKALGISSPSKEFMKVGQQSTEGMAIGLEKYSKVVEVSAATVGENAVGAMRRSISQMADIVSADVDMSPKIRPVLDLTDVKDKAGQIDTMLKTRPLRADVSYVAAKKIVAPAKGDDGTYSPNDPKPSFTYTQNNYSPKALSSAEVYRQTKNQLSTVKKGVSP